MSTVSCFLDYKMEAEGHPCCIPFLGMLSEVTMGRWMENACRGLCFGGILQKEGGCRLLIATLAKEGPEVVRKPCQHNG